MQGTALIGGAQLHRHVEGQRLAYGPDQPQPAGNGEGCGHGLFKTQIG